MDDKVDTNLDDKAYKEKCQKALEREAKKEEPEYKGADKDQGPGPVIRGKQVKLGSEVAHE